MIKIENLSLEAEDVIKLMGSFKINDGTKELIDEEIHEMNEEYITEKKANSVVVFEVNSDDSEDEINDTIIDVLKYVSNHKVKLQSNFSRYNSLLVSACASQGLITSIDEDGMLTDHWRLTLTGLRLITKDEY